MRGLIADAARPPMALVPPPFIQKEAPTGYSYQQINCLDSIIRCVCACVENNLIYKKKMFCHTVILQMQFIIQLSSSSIYPALLPCRYLDSCNIPNTVKRKCGSSSCTSTSDEDKQEANGSKGTSAATTISVSTESFIDVWHMNQSNDLNECTHALDHSQTCRLCRRFS